MQKRRSRSEDVEVFVHLRLPKNYYEVAAGLARIYDYRDFDEYVTDTMKREIELLLTDGAQPVYDSIHRRLTGESSDYVKRVNAQFEPINKRLKKMVEDNKEVTN